ncbi:hypothetical protein [Oryza sativa Japonica Group]|uniref:Uncharacterized protein n=2 Tax=Oryza sativa subsp. japonica TaxID=39947 RepID=Q7F432_ORYSJ|nr:hypothetical protein [Oryza sativa Japonica Group]BAB67967.1 hypothetical protein [Oryza sativa Japonica Group]
MQRKKTLRSRRNSREVARVDVEEVVDRTSSTFSSSCVLLAVLPCRLAPQTSGASTGSITRASKARRTPIRIPIRSSYILGCNPKTPFRSTRQQRPLAERIDPPDIHKDHIG